MKKKILLIEDDAILRENTAEILTLANYEVHEAANGKEGVEAARSFLPDVILCDIMMPELDGYGVIYMLSKDPLTSGIPFIFLSAKSEKSDVRKGMSMGADDYLTKPFEEMDLLAAIEGRIRRSEMLRMENGNTREGLDRFMDNVHELSSLKDLYQDRTPRTYKKKDTIYHQGDEPYHLYFLSKGKVKTFQINEEGKEYTMGLINEGEFFGHLPILEAKPYSDNAEALEDCEICRIPKDDVMTLLRKDRDVSNAFIKLITHNLYEKEKKLLSLAYDSVRKRTANALLELRDRFGQADNSEFSIDISRSDLASMVGTASESVIRTLGDLKEEGLIKVKGKQIHVVDDEGLRRIW